MEEDANSIVSFLLSETIVNAHILAMKKDFSAGNRCFFVLTILNAHKFWLLLLTLF